MASKSRLLEDVYIAAQLRRLELGRKFYASYGAEELHQRITMKEVLALHEQIKALEEFIAQDAEERDIEGTTGDE